MCTIPYTVSYGDRLLGAEKEKETKDSGVFVFHYSRLLNFLAVGPSR
jgi:hypothetical protein